MNILIILFSYNRPKLLRQALQSIEDSSYKNYGVVLIDDGSNFNVMEVAQDYNVNYEHYQLIKDTKMDKQQRGGSIIGKCANQSIDLLHDYYDVCFMLCDDDALNPHYMDNLNVYYSSNPDVNYSYSHIVPYDPNVYKNLHDVPITDSWLNKYGPINPFCQVDSSQVSWRLSAFRDHGVRFPEIKTANLDADLYAQLHAVYGDCPFNGFYSQYKAVWNGQLGIHQSYDTFDRED